LISIQDVQDDPTESPESHPIYLTARTTNRNKLGEIAEGHFEETKPMLSADVKERIKSLRIVCLR
jgi:hypothetical protein